jgi:hypothetical protein
MSKSDMTKLQTLQYQWRNFSVDRGKARREVQAEVDVKQEQINRLRDEINALENGFEETWKTRKIELRAALDEGVKAELRTGRPAQSILRELNSQNTVWMYSLAAEVKEEGPGGPEAFPDFPAVPDEQLDGVKWLHHDHTGVHRWLLSDDMRYIKRWGAEGSEFENEWFVCNRDYTFMAGNKALFEATSKSDMGKRVAMLEKLLTGTYAGKIKLQENRWVA